MTDIVIRAATPDRFDDVQHALTGGGDGRSCQCQWWTLTNTQWQAESADSRRELLRDETAQTPPPGLVAYVDGEPVGWVRVGPRTTQPRLARTRHFTATSTEPWDDDSVWAVSCFVVRKEHRGTGLMAALLDAAIGAARAGGARVIEGYPFVPEASARRRSANELFHGVMSVFVDAGFSEVGRPRPDLAVVSLAVAS